MYARILVPLDGSKSAEAVMDHVCQLAKCTGSEIILLHLVTYPHYDYLLTDAGLAASLREQMDTEAVRYLSRIAGELAKCGGQVRAEVLGVQGPVADAILAYAKEQRAELIALSTHGKRGPDGWVQGSVADRIVRRADVPVLIVRSLEPDSGQGHG
jgi:nucleotide-binding universal stress UspA family protein